MGKKFLQKNQKEKTPKKCDFSRFSARRRPDLNRCVLVLQTIALPLGYCALNMKFVDKTAITQMLQTGALPLGYHALYNVKLQ